MTGVKSNRNPRRDGQAMVEFMVGLVGILFLMVGLFQITRIAVEDFDTILEAREKVAEKLVSRAEPDGNQSYSPNAEFIPTLHDNIFYDIIRDEYMVKYNSSENVNGFSFYDTGDDPLNNMLGESKTSRIKVESLLNRLLGKNNITIRNAVWMPTWDDLMPIEGD